MLRLVVGEEHYRLGQRPKPSLVDPVGVHVVAPAERLADGRLEAVLHVRGQPAGYLTLLQPPGDQLVRPVHPVGADQRAEVLLIGIKASGILLHPCGQELDQIRVAALVAQQLGVRVPQRVPLVRAPLGVLVGHRPVDPRVGGLVLAAAGQRVGVLRLQVVVVGIVRRQFLPELKRRVGLAGLLQIVDPLPGPLLDGKPPLRLPPVDGFQHVDQREHLVGFENPGRLPQ